MFHCNKLLILALLAGTACAQSNQPGEYDLLKPGEDTNLTWIPYAQARAKAAEEKKAVMVYFFASEKTTKNARGMIAAEMRAFPDEKVKEIAEHLLCTKVDLLKPGDAAKSAPRKKAAAGEKEDESKDDLLLPTSQWPEEPAIYFFDYQGRPLQQLTKIPSSSKKMASSMTGIVKGNLKRVAVDERAAKKAEEKAAREKEKEEKKRAKEGKDDEGDEGDGDGDDGKDGDDGEDGDK